jgi:hypothetical protein
MSKTPKSSGKGAHSPGKAGASPTSVADRSPVTKSGQQQLWQLKYGKPHEDWCALAAALGKPKYGPMVDLLIGEDVTPRVKPKPADAIIVDDEDESDSDEEADAQDVATAATPRAAARRAEGRAKLKDLTPTELDRYRKKLSRYDEAVEKDAEKNGQFIAELQTYVEPDLRDDIAKAYPDMDVDRDIKKYRTALIRCVTKEFTYTDFELRQKIMEELVNFRKQSQGKGESIDNLKRRYLRILERFRSVGMSIPSDAEQAEDLIAALGPQFTSLVVHRETKRKSGRGMPQDTETERALKKAMEYVPNTLELAFDQAKHWKVDKQKEIADRSINFAAMKSENKALQKQLDDFKQGKQAPAASSKGGDKKRNVKPKANDQKSDERPPPQRECFCGERGHYASESRFKRS